MDLITLLVAIFLLIGLFFTFIGVLGILKFPDFYSRNQVSTCITTLGILGFGIASLIVCAAKGLPPIWYVKIILIVVFIMFTSAITGHAMSKGSYRYGIRPVKPFAKNDYKGDGYDA